MGRKVLSPTSHHALTTSALTHSCQGEFHCHTQTYSWHYEPHSRRHLQPKVYTLLLPCPTGPTNPNSNPWLAERTLRQQLTQLLEHSLATSTRATYTVGFRRFKAFCTKHNVPPLPASKLTVTYFAVSLSRSLSPSTIRVYISATRAAHREIGLPDPTHHNHQLTLVLRGIRRQHNPNTSRRREPITPPLLARMVRYIRNSARLSPLDRRMLSAAFTLAFHGFLRVSEFTMPPHTRFNPRLHPSTSHVELHRRYYTFYLPHSKTDQLHRGYTIRLTGATPVTMCPVRHMRAYLRTRPSMQGPLFTFSDGRPLTRHLCLHYLRSSLRYLGRNPEDFNTHSFRIGAATTAAHKGASEATIQHLGRWRSNAVKTYIRPYPSGH